MRNQENNYAPCSTHRLFVSLSENRNKKIGKAHKTCIFPAGRRIIQVLAQKSNGFKVKIKFSHLND